MFENQTGQLLAVLADGMGGHQAGDVASQMAVSNLGEDWQQTVTETPEKAIQWLIRQFQQENEVINRTGQEQPELLGMGTTLVAAILFPEVFALAHVGDSRAYLLRDGQIRQLTEDHSLVNELVKSGEITQEMAANHPRKNVLTRSIGMPGTVEVDVTTIQWTADDYLLFCSDGLTNMVSDATIAEVVNGPGSLVDKNERLIFLANEAGGSDNITVLLIALGEEAGQ
ncbi:protein phosphatase 2C [Enterococcus canis]|uniref:protein-serine/threonine phosphatase n=1 Tax=Enterococcus canis TaxID=214095 RepID=A0A1L8RGG4_9ENTE|nr:protein phosphatase 2C [Enterococcus canis]